MKIQTRSMAWILAAAALLSALPAWAAGVVSGITKPSGDVTLAFSRPGRLETVSAKEGDRVKAGQALAQQDAREEMAALAMDEAKAKDMTKIEAQKKILAQKEVDLKRTEWAFEKGAKSQFELDSARIEVEIAKAQLALAEFEHEQDVRKAQQTKVAVEKMILLSPIDGVVEQVQVKEGEQVDQQVKAFRVVNVNPLRIDIPVPLDLARTLKKGDTARVSFPTDATADGKIVNVNTVADPGSETLNVRVEVANDALRPAGERVKVEFVPSTVAAGDAR